MINWKSILSSFNDKPTLLEWLKLVEKALKESVLTNVLTDTKDGKTAFTFKFEDGTEITTDYVQTQGETGPQGATGPKGDKGDTGARGPQGPKGDTGQFIVNTCKIEGIRIIQGSTYTVQIITNVFNKDITDFPSFLAASKNKTIVSNGYISVSGDGPNPTTCPILSVDNSYQTNLQKYQLNISYLYQDNTALLYLDESDLTNFTMGVEKW